MNRERFIQLCHETEAGQNAHVAHPGSDEEGIVTGCMKKNDMFVVETHDGDTRHWNFRECDDLHHPKLGPRVG